MVPDSLGFGGELEDLSLPLCLGTCSDAMQNLHQHMRHPVPEAGTCGTQKMTPASDGHMGTDRVSSGSTLRE